MTELTETAPDNEAKPNRDSDEPLSEMDAAKYLFEKKLGWLDWDGEAFWSDKEPLRGDWRIGLFRLEPLKDALFYGFVRESDLADGLMCPFFPDEEAGFMEEKIGMALETLGITWTFTFSEDGDFTVRDPDADWYESTQPVPCEIAPGVVRPLYPVGAGRWKWREVEGALE